MTTQQQIKEQYLGNTCDVEMLNIKHTFTCLEVTFNSLNHAILHYYNDKFPDEKVVKHVSENGHIIYDIHLFFLKGRDTIYDNHEIYRCTYDYKHYNSFLKSVKIYKTLAEVDKESMEITADKMTFYCRTPIDEYRITIPYLFFIEDKQNLTLFISKESTGLQGCYYNKTNINDIVSNSPEFTNPLLKKIVYERFKFEEQVQHLDNSIKNLQEKRDNAKSQFLNCESALDVLVPLISDEPISFEENNVITTVLKNKNGGAVQIVKSTKI